MREPLTVFATDRDSRNSIAKECCSGERVGNNVSDANRSLVEVERSRARQSLNDKLPNGNDSMQGVWATDTADEMHSDEELAIGSLDRSYSVMSLL